MDTSTTHWPQGIGVVKPTMDQTNISKHQQNVLERRTRPQKDQALNCPRCNSTNTKFCYYNNYSLTQPRYFCKTCRRYWTEGGSLRNVPVGGGSRKNKRSSSSAPSASSSSLPSKQVSDNHLVPPSLNFPLAQSASQNPKIHQGQDLNLAYPPTSSTTTTHDHHDHHHHHQNSIATSFLEVPYNHNNKISLSSHTQNPNGTTTTSSSTSAMELLKTTGLMSSFIAMPVNPDHSNTIFSTGFSNLAQEFKPSLSFGLDHYNDQNSHQGYNGNNNIHGVQESTAIGERLLFPSEDLKQVSSTTTTTDHHQFELNKGQGDNISNIGYNWNGMLGHGGSW